MPGGIPLLYGSGTYDEDVYGGDTLTEETLMLIREKPPLRTSTEIVTPTGRRYRWAADAPDPDNVPGGQRWSDTMPGGYESYGATLPRKPGTDYRDLERLSTLTVTGAGGKTAGQYRLESAPSTSGDQMAVTPAAVGWQAHLDDQKDAREIYISRTLGDWGTMSRQRRVDLLDDTPAWAVFDGAVAQDLTTPAVLTTVTGVRPEHAVAEAWFRSPVDIGHVYYSFLTTSGVDHTDANWSWTVNAYDDDQAAGLDSSGELATASTGAGYFDTTATGKRATSLQFLYSAGGGAEGIDYELQWHSLAVYGTHGLDRQGTDPGGLYAHDIVRHAVQTWAPRLQITADSIQPATYIIPHLAFLEPTTASEIIKQASRFELPDWAVWEGLTFYWNPRNARARRWRARIGPSELEETGPQTDRMWNSIVVQYQDVDGTTRTVGPPGSGADTESDRLVDTDPDNPANRAGITRRDMLSIGTSTAERATDVGQLFLAEARLLERSGKARAVGHIEDDKGVLHPYWAPRAGDQICFTDAADCSYRRIVRTDKDEVTRTVTFDLDAPPEGLQAVLERFGAALVKLGL